MSQTRLETRRRSGEVTQQKVDEGYGDGRRAQDQSTTAVPYSRVVAVVMASWARRGSEVARRGGGRKERDQVEKESIMIPSSTAVEVNLTR